MNVEEFVDWIDHVEKIFGYFEVPETKKVKLVSMNFRGRASYWWEHSKDQEVVKKKFKGTILAFRFHGMKYVVEPVYDQYMKDGEDAIVEGEEDLSLATKLLQTSKQEMEEKEGLKGKILPTDFSIK